MDFITGAMFMQALLKPEHSCYSTCIVMCRSFWGEYRQWKLFLCGCERLVIVYAVSGGSQESFRFSISLLSRPLSLSAYFISIELSHILWKPTFLPNSFTLGQVPLILQFIYLHCNLHDLLIIAETNHWSFTD